MVNFDPSSNIFSNAAGAANEVWKILKKEEKKGKGSKILNSIKEFHLAHAKVKEELAKSISEETGLDIKPDSEMVDNMVFSLSLGKIFENRDGKDSLVPDLKSALQQYDSESPQTKEAVANKLSEGSKGKVPANDKLISKDIDEISMRTIENPDILFS